MHMWDREAGADRGGLAVGPMTEPKTEDKGGLLKQEDETGVRTSARRTWSQDAAGSVQREAADLLSEDPAPPHAAKPHTQTLLEMGLITQTVASSFCASGLSRKKWMNYPVAQAVVKSKCNACKDAP